MSIFDFLSRSNTVITDSTGYQLIIDATETEDPSYSAQVTEYNIETGSNRVDHSIIAKDTLSLKCVISDTPLDGLPGVADFARVLSSDKPSLNALNILKVWIKERELLTVSTATQTYFNQMITSLRPVRNHKTFNALHFTLNFKEVEFANSETVLIENPKTGQDAVKKPVNKATNKGRKDKKIPVGKKKSILATGVDSIRGVN